MEWTVAETGSPAQGARRDGPAAGARAILDLLQSGAPLQTLAQLFFWRTAQEPDAEALRYKSDGRWRSITYRAWEERVRSLAAALAAWVGKGDRVAILAENRPEWTYADLATIALGGVSAAIYPTDHPRDIAYVINDAGARTVFVSTAAQLERVRRLRDDGALPGLERVIVFDDVPREDSRVLPLADVLDRGRLLDGRVVEQRAAGASVHDLALLIYTSGTTGDRKGVMLSHANIVGNIDASLQHMGEQYFHHGLMLSFLPLSHSLERVAGYYLALRVGTRIAYAESIEKLPENLLEVRPTILMSVPRVYEKLYTKVQAAAHSSPVRQALFAWALAVGKERVARELEHAAPSRWLELKHRVADRLVFAKLRARLGGELRFAVTGGAPLRREIAEFLRAAGLMVVEGYGLTETSPVLTVNGPDNLRFGSVGRPIPGVEIRIAPEPGSERDGEVMARGPNVMLGYFNRERDTRDVIEPDGWFHTGDIGYLDADGYLFITDRKKELIKTSGGKYVAPAAIEGRLNAQSLIEQSCVIGDQRKYCVALIVPRFEVLQQELGRPLPQDRSRLDEDPEIRALFDHAIEAVNADLGHVEQIKRYALLPREFSHETGELTPTQKMKRRVIERHYKELIDSLCPPE
ncbi:MAG TPA: long-chain fatty acid--CoA ligase [Polyangia bacterium]|jgi:long-chain acyl-CoA synthetase